MHVQFRLLLIFLASLTNLYSQDTTEVNNSPYSFEVGTDLVSRFIWRGIENSNTPNIQPNGSFNLDLESSGKFTLGIWGTYDFLGNYSENDFYFQYSIPTSAGEFSAAVNDYYFPYLGIPFSNTQSKGNGAHTIELALSYHAPECLPVYITGSGNIHNDPEDEKSFYIEAGYGFELNDVNLSFFAGAANGVSSWYSITTNRFEVINLGLSASKEITITEDFAFLIESSLILNLYHKLSYIVFRMSM